MLLRRLFPVLAVALVGLGSSWALSLERAGSPAMFFALGAAEVAALAVGLVALRGDTFLAPAWTPRWGDLRNGFLLAVLGWAAATGGAKFLAGSGSFDAELLRVYVQVGPWSGSPAFPSAAALLVVVALEETVWRWLVPRALLGFVPARLAWLLSAVLYALAHVPSARALALGSSPNYLVAELALGLGLVLGGTSAAVGRVVPGFFAHLFFDLALLGPFALVRMAP